MRKFSTVIFMLGYYAAIIAAGILYGFAAVLLVILGGCCAAFCAALNSDDDCEDMPDHDSCKGCKHDLGGEQCRINLEAECGKGEHEAWEARR